jgi:hypothetical protein
MSVRKDNMKGNEAKGNVYYRYLNFGYEAAHT